MSNSTACSDAALDTSGSLLDCGAVNSRQRHHRPVSHVDPSMADVSDAAVDAALADLDRPHARPTVLEWLRYAISGTAPERCRTWVLHDITCRTWALRHAARSLVLLAPFLIAVLLLPLSLGMRLLILANAGLPGLLGCMLLILNATERRLARAGYPSEVGQLIRHRRAVDKQRASNHARRERIAARRAARLDRV
jgi:hypothetical protein